MSYKKLSSYGNVLLTNDKYLDHAKAKYLTIYKEATDPSIVNKDESEPTIGANIFGTIDSRSEQYQKDSRPVEKYTFKPCCGQRYQPRLWFSQHVTQYNNNTNQENRLSFIE